MSEYLDALALVRLGIVRSRFAAYRALRRGELPKPVKVAGKFLWNRKSLDAFLAGRAAS